jgi:hypothetical protein
MKKAIFVLSIVFVSFALNAQTHLPESKSFIGFWRLTEGMMHGSKETTGMFKVNNPDGTFYLFLTSGSDSTYASILQYGTYKMTSDSTCIEQIVKHPTEPAMNGSTFLIKFRFIDDNTMISQWKLNNSKWFSEKWSRVQ